jgi:hypothetical protein
MISASRMNRKRILILLTITIVVLQIVIVGAQAPYEIEISPMYAEIEKTDPITYTVDITASPGFEEPIDIVLEVSVLTETRTYEFGTAYPPYPQTFTKTITVPEEVPAGVTIEGKILAISGSTVVEEDVELKIKGGNFITQIFLAILKILNGIIDFIRKITG